MAQSAKKRPGARATRTPAKDVRHARTQGDETLRAALELTAGAAIVLDDRLRVQLATDLAETILGSRLPRGGYAPDLLCASGTDRPFAAAIAAGVAAEAMVVAPGDPTRRVQIRALPLPAGRSSAGWLLVLSDGGREPGEASLRFHGMWTRDPRMKLLFHLIEKVAPQDMTVLVRGETGAGKELVAAAVHALSSRSAGPFRAINCAALPPSLLESELFGHARGAFTGANQDAPGHVLLAHKGTLFLDEVAEVPLELQAKLLRVVETGSVLPVGGRDPIPVDVRFVSATHRSLRRAVDAGRFRADLMFRLRVIPLFLPPLRDRRDDIALLAEKLLDDIQKRGTRRVTTIAPGVLRAFEHYPWPGNVRELKNVLMYAYAVGEGPSLRLADLPPEISGSEGTPGAMLVSPTDRAVGLNEESELPLDPQARRIVAALRRASGNRDRAAKLLGVSRVTLWRRMRDLGLDASEK